MAKFFEFLVYIFQKIFFTLSSIFFSAGSYIIDKFSPGRNGRLSRIWLRYWGRLGVWCHFSRVKYINRPDFIKETCVIINNHQSEIDIYVAAGYFPIDFIFFSKKEVFANPFIGYGMLAARYIPVDRNNLREAAKALLKSKERLKQKISVLFYPEGTYSVNPAAFLEFKGGAFSIAAKTKLPIFPIIIFGTQAIYNDNTPTRRKPGKILIKFLDIIDINNKLHPVNAQSKKELEVLCEKYRQMMQKEYWDIASVDSN